MDPKLAEIYGTNQPTEADVEKLAAAELAEELSENEEANIDGMSDDDVEALAQQVLDSENTEETETDSDLDEESLEKVSEADYLGRVMAHSYVNELRNIEEVEKQAAAGKVMSALRRGATRVGRAAEAVGSKLTPKKLGDKAFSRGKMESLRKARKGGASMADLKKTMTQHRAAGHAAESRLHKGVGGAAAAGAAGLAGYGAKKALEKKSSALDTLAERRAIEILEANGIDPETLSPQQEKVSSAEALGNAVDTRAWEILGQFGFEPSEE